MRRRLIFSVADQGIVSAFNFALNLFLVRMAAPEEFGVFAIISAVSLFATMVQNAIVSTPLSVHLPIAADAERRARLLRVFSAANVMLSGLLLASGFIAIGIWLGIGRWPTVLGASFYLVTQFVREYYRSLLAVQGKLAALLCTDIACMFLAATTLAGLHVLGRQEWPIIDSVFVVVGMAGALTIVPACIASGRMLPLRGLAAEMAGVFAEQMHEIRWSLLGVITTEIQNRGYIYIAAAVFGPATVAQLQAGRILFGPLNLLTNAWARVARPQLAGLIGNSDEEGFNTALKRAFRGFAAFNVLFLGGLWLAWAPLSSLVFNGKYDDLGSLVAAWGLANIVFQSRSCLGIGVQAMRRFRELTMATIAGAAVSIVLVTGACFARQPAWLIAAVIAGECVALAIVISILRQRPDVQPAVSG